MKSKILYIVILVFMLIYTSCSKISESLQQDIIVKDSVLLDIPVITDIATPVTTSNIESPLNFEEQVKAQVQDLNINDLSSVKLTSVNVDLIVTDTVDAANNFGNLQFVKLQIVNGTKTDSLASINIASAGLSSTLALSPRILPETLKPILSIPSLHYNITTKAKKVTTTVMKAKARIVYTVTLSK